MDNNETQTSLQPVVQPTRIDTLNAVDNCIQDGTGLMESVNNSLQSAEGCLNAINDCLTSVSQITAGVCSSITEWKQIDKEMLAMDLHFEQFSRQLESDMDKYRARIPIIEKELDAINANLSKILDFVLTMETRTDQEVEMKMRWMDKMDTFLNTISMTMIKML